MRASLVLAAAALLAGCGGNGRDGKDNCAMTLSGEGADPSLHCEFAASPTEVQVSKNGGPFVPTWGLVIHGYRDAAQDDQAVVSTVIFEPDVQPSIGTYSCAQGSDPPAAWSADALRGSSPSVLTHRMFSPDPYFQGVGSLSVTFTSVTSSFTPSAPTHGVLDATLVAVDGSGKTLTLHVDF